jgi:phospholipid-binding lipoprotein MlaA
MRYSDKVAGGTITAIATEYSMPMNRILTVAFSLLALTISGCATQTNKDPLEGLNRGIYKFNKAADEAIIKPVAGAYKAVLPSPVRTGVNNFFSNLNDFVTTINDLLQFKPDKAFADGGRFIINSTFGIAGIFDWASKDGIEKRNEDFGQTLARWGWQDSTYVMLPLLGPSTVRDTGGLVVDSALFDPIGYADPAPRNAMIVVKAIDTRAQYLPGSDLLDEAALDPYIFMRDAYMQRREAQIMDGEDSLKQHEDGEDDGAEPAADKTEEEQK